MTDLLGQTIGNYQIEAPLGKGGMGQVYRGRHLRLGRPAAIKVIHAAFSSDAAFRARFQQEARTAAGLTHPHIVTIYDYGEQNGSAYLAMELINGGSLRDRLREQAATGQGWPLATGLELIRQAAEALDYAHAAGMVHRDIKPDNLLLESDASADADAPPLLKVGDFGLARLTAESHLTATGTAMGTPAYMSPEQCRGGDLDGRSDLYALGVVLYELATGRVPFIVKTPFDAVYQHLNVAPPPPRQLRPDLPPALEYIMLRCLAKAPQDRFPTGAALALALQQVLGGDLAVMESMVVPIPEAELFENLAATALGAAPTPGLTPAVATLMGGTRPLIRVLDAQGATLQVLELRGARLTIGRAPDNDLHLEGQGVSRHHLSVTWDGTQVLLTDLGAANGTLLAGQPLPPSTPTLWPWRVAAQLGAYWLRLEPPVALVAPTPSAGSTPALGGGMTASFATGSLSRSFALTERLEMRLESPTSTLTPGQPTPVRLTLTNRGRTPDQVNLTVSGIPESWVSSGATVLRAGEQATLTLTVLVPADTEVAAGERLVKVRARSKERPSEGAQAEGRWTVLPFQAVRVGLTPARAVGRRQAHYQISVENAGNAPARYHLAVEDDTGALTARVEPEEVELAAGERSNVRLVVGQAGRLVGATLARRFVVQATATTGGSAAATDSASGQFVQPALLPTVWGIPSLLVLLALLLSCAFGALPRTMAGQLPGYGILAAAPARVQATTPQSAAAGSEEQAANNLAIQQITQTAIQAAIAGAADVQPPTQTFVAGIVGTATAAAQTAIAVAAQATTATAIAAQNTAASAATAPQPAADSAQQSPADSAQQTSAADSQTAAAAGQADSTAATQPTAITPAVPTATPTATPTNVPTETSTDVPTETPTDVPTDIPTEVPTVAPTVGPTVVPTVKPTVAPTVAPTVGPKAIAFTISDSSKSFDNAPIRQPAITFAAGSVAPLPANPADFRFSYVGTGGTTYPQSTTPPKNVGTYQVSVTIANASYSGSTTQAFTISPAATTTTAANPATITFSVVAQNVTLNAHVTSLGGTVTFSAAGFPAIAAATVNAAGNATANLVVPAGTPAGTYTINAAYSGAGNFAGSADTTTLTINKAATTTNLTLNPATIAFNTAAQTVTISVHVTGTGGTVTFTVAGFPAVAPATVDAAGNATATLTIPAGKAAGTYTITATYNGTANYIGSSDTTTLTITP